MWRGWITRRLVWRAQKLARTSFTQRSNDMALPWHSHCDQLTVRFELGSKRISSYSPSGCIHHAISIRKIGSWLDFAVQWAFTFWYAPYQDEISQRSKPNSSNPCCPTCESIHGKSTFLESKWEITVNRNNHGKRTKCYTCKDHHTSYLVWIIALDVDGDDLPMGKQIGKPMQFDDFYG